MKQIDLALFWGPAWAASADTLLIPIPEDERPLGGDAGRIDWRMCGELSQLLQSGYLTGRLGDAVLLPGDRLVSVGRILLFGVGPREVLPGRRLSQALRAAIQKLFALRTESVVLALPQAIGFEADAEELLMAFIRTLAGEPGQPRLRLVFPEAERREQALSRAFGQVLPQARARGVDLMAHHVQERPGPRVGRIGHRSVAPTPIV